jgi:CopG-like RHH_1 or ribbon-helix-helix domain, RHH_5
MAAYPASMAAAFRSPRRITITMPHHAYLALQERCDDEGRSLSNLAAYLLETALVKGG